MTHKKIPYRDRASDPETVLFLLWTDKKITKVPNCPPYNKKNVILKSTTVCPRSVVHFYISTYHKKIGQNFSDKQYLFYFCLALYSREDMPVMCIISDAFPCFLCGRRYNDLKSRFMDPDPAALVGLGSWIWNEIRVFAWVWMNE